MRIRPKLVGPSRCAADSTARDHCQAFNRCSLDITVVQPKVFCLYRLNIRYTSGEAMRAMGHFYLSSRPIINGTLKTDGDISCSLRLLAA